MILQHLHIDLDRTTILNKCLKDSYNRNLKPYYVPTSDIGVLENITHSYGDTKKHTQPHTWDELQPLVRELNRITCINTIHRSWYSIMSYGGHVREHHHPKGEKYVCVYYAEVLPEHNPIEFKLDDWVAVYPKPGDFFIFPKECLHRVAKQLTCHQIRCTINFEI
jgi:hypothetical protein